MKDHPSLETLLDLTLDNLPEDEAFDLREQLIERSDYRERLQDLLEVPEAPPEGEPVLSEAEKRQSWEQIAKKLDAEGYEIGTPPQTSAPTTGKETPENSDADVSKEDKKHQPSRDTNVLRFPPTRRPMILAGTTAAAMAIVFTTGLMIGRREIPEAATRVATWTSVTGEPELRRGDATKTETVCPNVEGQFIWGLSLSSVALTDQSQLRVEVTLPNGNIEELAPVQPDNFARIFLTRSRQSTPDGTYTVQVFNDNSSDALETFRFIVSCN